MNATEMLIDMDVEYKHYLERYKNNVYLALAKMFDKMAREIKKVVRIDVEGRWTLKLRNSIIKKLKEVQDKYFTKIDKAFTKELKSFHISNAQTKLGFLEKVIDEADAELETFMIEEETFDRYKSHQTVYFDGQTHSYDSLALAYYTALRADIETTIEGARVQGHDITTIEENLNSHLNKSRNHLNAWVLTAMAIGTAFSDQEFTKANPIFNGYQWISVLDAKTTEMCSDRNGKVWYYNAPNLSTLQYEEYPPIHYRCRSTTALITRTAEELGLTSEKAQQIFDGKPVQVPTYSAWLESQPAATQQEILGKTRYAMYKKGEPITGFLTSDNRILSLAELEELGKAIPAKYTHYIRR